MTTTKLSLDRLFKSMYTPKERELFRRRKVPRWFIRKRNDFPPGYIAHLCDLERGAKITNDSIRDMLKSCGWDSAESWENFDVTQALTYNLEEMCVIEAKLLMEHGVNDDAAEIYHRKHFSAP